jgi:hypothetical protein
LGRASLSRLVRMCRRTDSQEEGEKHKSRVLHCYSHAKCFLNWNSLWGR